MSEPRDMILHCPECGSQHIDEADPDKCQDCGHPEYVHFNLDGRLGCNGYYEVNYKLRNVARNLCICEGFNPWLNPPHKSHRCARCNHVWRPFDFPTNGISFRVMREKELAALQEIKERALASAKNPIDAVYWIEQAIAVVKGESTK